MKTLTEQRSANALPNDLHGPEALQLLATGLNAHGQLSESRSGQDITSFTAVTEPRPPHVVRLLYPGWSTTVLQINSRVVGLGLGQQQLLCEVDGDEGLFDAFGDHNRMLGCLDARGRLWTTTGAGAEVEDEKLVCHADPDGSPLIGHIAVAGNGKVAITFKQAPNGRLCHILCFDSLDELVGWYSDPANAGYDAEKQHFMMQGQPRQLLAGTGTFLLRMESGEVYSWGDARYSSLGRSIAEAPAERPGLVEALGGLKIQKIACGGWLNAALSEDGACYLWGAATPGTEQRIKCLREAEPGEVVLVELPSDEAGGEPLDVLDVAVGDNHIMLLAEGNRCFAAGENKNGQCGLGHDQSFVDDWARLAVGSHQLRSIVCGPKSSYVPATGSG